VGYVNRGSRVCRFAGGFESITEQLCHAGG
jgi:hypothetical protein